MKSVQWKFAGIQIETRHPYRLDGLYGQFLDIVNATREHAGVYECSSTSSWYGGSLSGNQTLVVECILERTTIRDILVNSASFRSCKNYWKMERTRDSGKRCGPQRHVHG